MQTLVGVRIVYLSTIFSLIVAIPIMFVFGFLQGALISILGTLTGVFFCFTRPTPPRYFLIPMVKDA
jgi:hypothetical protein